jgi:hypothetical protein
LIKNLLRGRVYDWHGTTSCGSGDTPTPAPGEKLNIHTQEGCDGSANRTPNGCGQSYPCGTVCAGTNVPTCHTDRSVHQQITTVANGTIQTMHCRQPIRKPNRVPPCPSHIPTALPTIPILDFSFHRIYRHCNCRRIGTLRMGIHGGQGPDSDRIQRPKRFAMGLKIGLGVDHNTAVANPVP